MSKARRVSKILDGELKTDAVGLKNPTREAPPSGLENQSDANIYLHDRVEALETPEGLPDHTHEYADKQHDHPKEDYEHDHDTDYADKRHRHDSDYAAEGHSHDQKYELLTNATSEHQRLDEKIDNHAGNEHKFLPLAGGTMNFGAKVEWSSNDGIIDGLAEAISPQSPVRKKEFDSALLGGDENLAKIEANTEAIEKEVQDRKDADAGKADVGHTHDADTAPHTHDEYQAKGDYADGNHTHPPQDLTHDHDGTYAPVHEHPYAADDHAHPPQDLTHDHDGIYAPVHEHPYAADDHEHDTTHSHDDYFLKGSGVDDNGDALPLPYNDAFTLGEAVNEVKEENGEQNDRLDDLEAHTHPDAVIVTDEEPQPKPGEEIAEGTLWYDTDRLEMFIFYEGGWITTSALGARVEQGEAIQRELMDRVAAGETAQASLQASVVTKSGEQSLEDGNWKIRKPNNNGGQYTYIQIDNDEMGLYHVKDPTNDVHAANKRYVDEQSSLGRPFVYGESDLPGHFTTSSGSTSIYFNKADANGRVRRHRHAPDFDWGSFELKYTIWDENGVLVHAGVTGGRTDYNEDKLQFKNCLPRYDMGMVEGTTYYINLEGYW